MDALKAKKELRVEKEDKFLALTKKAGESKLSELESKELDSLESEISALDTEIEKIEKIEAAQKKIVARQSANPRSIPGASQDNASEVKELKQLASTFSISKAMQKAKSGRSLDGAEAEVKQMAEQEAKEYNLSLEGQISIPSSFIKIGTQKSALTVGTEGADVVFTEYGGKVIPYLNPDPVAARLGVTFLQGLNGNVQWPRVSGDLAFAFETETSDVDETTPTFDNVSVSPKRFGGYVDVTLQIQKQAPFMVDAMIRNMLNLRYQITLDQQIFNGSGSGNQTTGLFNISGVNTLSLGSGSANNMTYPGLLSMKRDCRAANARNGRAGWVTNAYGEFALFQTAMQASGVEGNFILKPDYNGRMLADPFLVSEIIPSNFSEGGQTDLCGIAYSSNWGGLICGLWGGIDLTYDPITQKLGGKDRFIVNAFMDVDVEQPLEFAICKDWDASDLPALT
jgi:HK97 family phage major capsid protein